MKAFITTIIVPNDWMPTDICTAVNIGIRKHSEDTDKPNIRNSIAHSVTVIDKFELKRQDI